MEKVACDLLRNTEDRVSDIATEVGIPDYNYFTKVFKKAMGVTPREYRKSMRKQIQKRTKKVLFFYSKIEKMTRYTRTKLLLYG